MTTLLRTPRFAAIGAFAAMLTLIAT